GSVASKVLGPVLSQVAALATSFVASFASTLAVTLGFQFASTTVSHFWSRSKNRPSPETKEKSEVSSHEGNQELDADQTPANESPKP
ncbi:MAG: hypothetical protein KDH94_07770, partial [Coxiellaceae bacterium]|nr:hypothetical protein [Coxiellaceae bacterium]